MARILSGGRLRDNVRASAAIPIVSPPFVLDGEEFIDGGVNATVPIADGCQARRPDRSSSSMLAPRARSARGRRGRSPNFYTS